MLRRAHSPRSPGTSAGHPRRLGVAELSHVAGMTAAGVGPGAAAAAVLFLRVLAWFVPIPLGLGAWPPWRRGVGRVTTSADPAQALQREGT